MFSSIIKSIETMQVEDLEIIVYRKKIKNIYLRVLPPQGEITLSVPSSMKEKNIKDFLLSKKNWIVQKKSKLSAKIYQPLNFINGETHYFLNKPYTLQVLQIQHAKSQVTLKEDKIILTINPNTKKKPQEIIDAWYRKKLLEFIHNIAHKWEEKIGVKPQNWRIKKMKTRWGTCNPYKKQIWINLELIKKEPRSIEYVMVHELIHFLEIRHNHRFYRLMSQFFPDWKIEREKLKYF